MRFCEKRKYLSLLFIALYAVLWISSTLCFHQHIVDGKVVSHSHPFAQEHSHSSSEMQLISALALTFFALPAIAVVLAPIRKFIVTSNVPIFEQVSSFCDANLALRAPPVC